MEPKPTYKIIRNPTTPQKKRATIAALNEVCKRALNQNAAIGNESLSRAIQAVQIHASAQLAKEPHIE